MATQTQNFLQGEVVDGKFELRRYLGGSQHGSVFLTQFGDLRPRDAAIKLVAAPPGNAEAQLSLWRLAANLSHPHLMQIWGMGRCEVGRGPMLYVVTEFASENLAEIIPERALSVEEARETLAPLLDALAFMHGRGFVHAHIKPSNIMAVGEKLKLSSDGICRLGDDLEKTGPLTIYDPPEGNRNGASPAGDIWSLGVTLVEVLTQELPESSSSDRRDPVVPETMPAPYAEFARHCLRRDPKHRWTAADIAAHLPRFDRAAVPSAPVQTVPDQSIAVQPAAAEILSAPASSLAARPPYLRGAAVLAAVLVAIFAGSKLMGRHPAGQIPKAAPSSATARPEIKPAPTPSAPVENASLPLTAQPVAPPIEKQPAVPPVKEEAKQQNSQPRPIPSSPSPAGASASAARPQAALAPPAAAAPREEVKPHRSIPVGAPPSNPRPSQALEAAASDSPQGNVVHEVFPKVPKKASDTIWGTVRVGVTVSVDAAGNVIATELDSAGPSKYFAALSLQAARNWRFAPPKSNGQAVSSVWILHFGYAKTGTTILPRQTQP
jgi:eukaryotic-like serine/threonine-protein kinase